MLPVHQGPRAHARIVPDADSEGDVFEVRAVAADEVQHLNVQAACCACEFLSGRVIVALLRRTHRAGCSVRRVPGASQGCVMHVTTMSCL